VIPDAASGRGGAGSRAGTGVLAWIARLWLGDVPLAVAFWDYAIIYGISLNLIATFTSFGLLAVDAPAWAALGVLVLPVPYNILVFAAVWRSAGRHQGAGPWAAIARIVIIVWLIAACAL
jgi:hypothetical protein